MRRTAISLLILAVCGCGPEIPLSAPQWAPRSTMAAFVRYGVAGGDLYLVDTASDGTPELVAEGAERFAFSPDGARLYFCVRPRTEGTVRPARLAVRELGGNGAAAGAGAGAGGVPGRTLLEGGPGESFPSLLVLPDGALLVERRSEARSALLKLDANGGNRRQLSPEGANWRNPVLAPDGRHLACAAAGADGGLELLRVPVADGRPAVLQTLEKTSPESVLLAWSPNGDRLAAVLAAENRHELLVIDSTGKVSSRYELPRGREPLLLAFAPQGNRIAASLLTGTANGAGAADDNLGSESWELDLVSGKWKQLAAARGRLVGAPAFSPGGADRLELTAGGLALFRHGTAEPLRIWPVGQDEVAAAVSPLSAAGQGERALNLVLGLLEKAGPDADRSALHALKSRALEALGRHEDAANALLESLLRYPVTDVPIEFREAARRLAAWAEREPENQLLGLTAGAVAARSGGELLRAARAFGEAADFSGDRAWAAGLKFQAAMTLLDAGRGSAAAPLFRQASEEAEFPQADWAAGLCVLAYAMGDRPDMAREELLRCRDLYGTSRLQDDFAALAPQLAAGAGEGRVLEHAGQNGSSARIEVWPVRQVHLALSPRRPAGGGAPCRLALASRDLHRLVLSPAGGAEKALLDRVPVGMSGLSFSPDGSRLALLAGDGAGRSLYCFLVPSGRLAMGDLDALLAARPGPVSAPNGFSWPETGLLPVPKTAAGR
jgi:Tol biopolymer transport system component